jgi:8-hydroxy-5-deazaflavin:NADPH oxidoreductase
MLSTAEPEWPARETIGIVGCGRMGSALACAFSRCEFPVRLASRSMYRAQELALHLPGARAGSPEWVTVNSDIVILATPLAASCGELGARLRPLVGSRPVIDVSNPGLDGGPRPCGSAATRIAGALRSHHVVKALNCIAARWLAHFPVPAPTVTVPVAADDVTAKQQVTAVLRELGLDVADAGPLCNSSWIEGLAELLAHIQFAGSFPETVGFRLVRTGRDLPAAEISTASPSNYMNQKVNHEERYDETASAVACDSASGGTLPVRRGLARRGVRSLRAHS